MQALKQPNDENTQQRCQRDSERGEHRSMAPFHHFCFPNTWAGCPTNAPATQAALPIRSKRSAKMPPKYSSPALALDSYIPKALNKTDTSLHQQAFMVLLDAGDSHVPL